MVCNISTVNVWQPIIMVHKARSGLEAFCFSGGAMNASCPVALQSL
jgi:hypothetical protein